MLILLLMHVRKSPAPRKGIWTVYAKLEDVLPLASEPKLHKNTFLYSVMSSSRVARNWNSNNWTELG